MCRQQLLTPALLGRWRRHEQIPECSYRLFTLLPRHFASSVAGVSSRRVLFTLEEISLWGERLVRPALRAGGVVFSRSYTRNNDNNRLSDRISSTSSTSFQQTTCSICKTDSCIIRKRDSQLQDYSATDRQTQTIAMSQHPQNRHALLTKNRFSFLMVPSVVTLYDDHDHDGCCRPRWP